MAQAFDSNKATKDLKHLLNMSCHNNIDDSKPAAEAHDSTLVPQTEAKKKTRRKGKNSLDKNDKLDVGCDTPATENIPMKASTNSNGNALVTSSDRVQNVQLRTESSISVSNSKDSKPSSAKSKNKKDKEKKQQNMKDTPNIPQPDGEAIRIVKDKTTAASPQSKTISSQSSLLSSNSNRDSNESMEPPKVVSKRKDSSQKPDVNSSQKEKGKTTGKLTATSAAKSTKLGDEDLTPEFLDSLEPHKIHVLKKKNQRFPKARFFCRLCDYHLDRKEDCEKHMQENRHCRRKEVNEVDAILKGLPSPTPKQLNAITESLDKVDLGFGISEEERETRLKIVQRLGNTLREKIPDVILYMYGTSLTRMGLKAGDINVDLNSTDQKRKLTVLLKEIHEAMKDRTDTGFSNVHSDFSATVPALLLTDTETGFKVSVTIHCYSAHCSSELMAIYTAFDERVRKLCVAFRYWAHLCGLDRQADGFIPPVALNIMVIFFLQCITPAVVPVIVPPKVNGEERGDFKEDAPAFQKLKAKVMKSKGQSKNTMSMAELWLQLLKFYSIEFDTPNIVVSIRSSTSVPRTTKPWNSKKLAVEDPYMLKKNVTRMVNNSRIYEFWQDCIRKAYHYFGLPRDESGKSPMGDENIACIAKKERHASVASAKSVNVRKDNVASETSKQGQGRCSSKPQEKGKVSESSNSTDSQSSQNRVVIPPNPLLVSSYQTSGGNDSQGSMPDTPYDISSVSSSRKNSDSGSQCAVDEMGNESQRLSESDGDSVKETDKLSPAEDSPFYDDSISVKNSDNFTHLGEDVCSIDQGVKELSVSSSTPSAETSDHKSVSSVEVVSQKGSHSLSSDTEVCGGQNPVNTSDSVDADNQQNSPTQRGEMDVPPCMPMIALFDCFYDFNSDVFTDGKGPTLVCTTCEKEGHLKNSCPEDELPPILNLPPMTQFHRKVLEETLKKVPYEVGLSKDSFQERQHFIQRLEKFIKFHYADAQLCLFGSSCNGFGFERSDIDICMTFARGMQKQIDKVFVIENLAHILKQTDELYSVQAISTAKVPIVKFTVRGLGLEGDISLYNTLAQENTYLLWCYSQIDPRVKILGYTIKTFAKVCDIGDASRGSLSSYAYILMMLYYLQQVKPAVIPVLQELYTGDEKPKNIVEDCDAWFMSNLNELPKFWPEKGKNTMSAAELWLGFLRFYVEEFNYKEFVVSIRQKELLTRFDKLWNGTSIAIEDPFDLNHNLGSGLTRTMNNFIFKTFINGRMLYGSPIDENMEMFKKYQNASDYFFDTELLSESRPPNVRGCRRCGKIGHMVRHCPHNKKDKEVEQKKHQIKQQEQQQQGPSAQQKHPPNIRHTDQQSQSQQPQQYKQQASKQPQHQHQQQHHQQQHYRPSPKHTNQQPRHKPHQQQVPFQQQMQKEKDWRDREYRNSSSNNNVNNNNAMRAPPHSDPSLPFNSNDPNKSLVLTPSQLVTPPPSYHLVGNNQMHPFLALYLNSHPGLVPNVPRGIATSHNMQDPSSHSQMSHPMQMPNRFPTPHGPGPSHPGNPSKLPPSLMSPSPRTTAMPGVYYHSYTEPPPRPPNFRMAPPSHHLYHESSGSAPPNYGGRPHSIPPSLAPVVQSLFASTQGQVLDAGSMGHKNQPRKQ